jgi:hypothetical protein
MARSLDVAHPVLSISRHSSDKIRHRMPYGRNGLVFEERGDSSLLVSSGFSSEGIARDEAGGSGVELGVEDVYPAAKPVAKKPAKVQIVAHGPQSAASNDADAPKQNTHRVALKTNVVSAAVA